MYGLKLNEEEQRTLIQILECSISDLHSQIVHTDRYEYKNMLKSRKQILLGMLESLRQPEIQH